MWIVVERRVGRAADDDALGVRHIRQRADHVGEALALDQPADRHDPPPAGLAGHRRAVRGEPVTVDAGWRHDDPARRYAQPDQLTYLVLALGDDGVHGPAERPLVPDPPRRAGVLGTLVAALD